MHILISLFVVFKIKIMIMSDLRSWMERERPGCETTHLKRARPPVLPGARNGDRLLGEQAASPVEAAKWRKACNQPV
jgi:hypothetical protein